MFNFDLLNEAVFDTDLTDKEFRLLYVIANNAAMNNTDTVQLHNGWLMDKLNCCERQIRRLTNSLNQKEYVIKTVTSTPKNKNANTYTLKGTLQADKNVPPKTSVNMVNEDKPQYADKNVDKNVPPKTSVNMVNEDKPQYADKNVDKNVPPKNNKKIKENNNNLSILELKDLGPKVTEDKKENKIKEKVNEMRNAVLNEMEREVKDNEIQTSTPDEKNTNFNAKEPVYGNLTDDLFDEIFGEENEMSDNGTSEMNSKSEMKCNVQHNINEMTTSTQGNIINSNSDNGENKVQSGKVITNCSIFTENCPKPYLTPQIPLTPLSSPNKAAGCVENTSMDNLYTSTEKTQPDAKEVAKTQNNAYSIQEWMTEYEKLLLQVENTDIEDVRFNSILDEGIKLFESFPKNKGNYQRAMQDLRYWAANKLDFKKTFKISEQWGKYYRAA